MITVTNKVCPFYFLLFLMSAAVYGHAQHSKTDSLVNLLGTAKEDTTKINILNSLAWQFKGSNPDTALLLGTQALQLAEQQAWKKGMALSYKQIGVFCYSKGDYSPALENYIKALSLYETLKDDNGKTLTLGNIGVIYDKQGDYPRALDYYLRALKIDEARGNKKGISRQLGNIGIVYYEEGDREKALDYYFRALKLREENGDKKEIAITLGNIGIVYEDLGEYSRASAYYFKALKINEALADEYGIGHHLFNIGNMYKSLGDSASRKNNGKYAAGKFYPLALEYFGKALKIDEGLGNKSGVSINLGGTGEVLLKLNKLKEAEAILLRALSIADSIEALDLQRDHHLYLSELYDRTEKYSLAFEHYRKYIAAKDSLFSEEKNTEITRKEMSYEFEKKEAATRAEQDKKDVVSLAESRKQRIIIFSVSAGFLLILILAVVILRSLRLNKKKNRIILLQKEQVEKQKHLVEEKQKEILDSIYYARRIQRALITNERYIKKNLERLIAINKS